MANAETELDAASPGEAETLAGAMGSALRACYTAPDGVARPAAILWTDPRGEWRALVRLLRDSMPELITLGTYRPGDRIGPAIWVRCVVDGAIEGAERTPIVYLPEISRQQLRAGCDCPRSLQPLIELMYRGTMWLQRSGHDWTVSAFLSSDTALALDLARDAATREALMRALPEVAVTPLSALRGRRLDSDDFDRLLAGDPIRDLLRWMSDPAETRQQLGEGRWAAMNNQCRSKLAIDPGKDDVTVAGERLGRGDGSWGEVWDRYVEAPHVYPGIPELLRRSKTSLGLDPSRWPGENDDAETVAQRRLGAVPSMPHAEACVAILELEQEHGKRRGWIWAKLEQSPMASLLEPLARLATHAHTTLGGSSPSEFAAAYTDAGWEADAAAWEAMAMARPADEALARDVVTALLTPWLDASARAFQTAVERTPLPDREGQPVVEADPGTCLLFADGLRYDLAMCLVAELEGSGLRCRVNSRWAALPTVTATAKPAVTPVAPGIEGESLPDDFAPSVDGKPVRAQELRKQMKKRGYQIITGEDLGVPMGADSRGWIETGQIDALGHKLEARLAGSLRDEIEILAERVRRLLSCGWTAVRIVTDHGWLYSPGGLPRIDLPKHLTESRWSRCAAIRGDSRVEVPTQAWHWNRGQRFATAPGAACFNIKSYYSHGGVSVQECVIPDIRVESATERAARAGIRTITWRGMRCFIEADVAGGTIRADLRIERPNGPSAAATVKQVEDDGSVSLVIEDDRHETADLVAVLLGSDDSVVAQRKTKVGRSS